MLAATVLASSGPLKCLGCWFSIPHMSTAKDRILQDALSLDPQERADVITRLIESLEPATATDREAVERAWAAEIERRCANLDAGRTSMRPWAEVRQALDAEILKR